MFQCPFLDPNLTTYCFQDSVQIIFMLELDTSTSRVRIWILCTLNSPISVGHNNSLESTLVLIKSSLV